MLTCASGRSISTVVSISLIPNPESLLQQSLRPLSPGSKRRNLPAVTGKVKLSLKTSRRYICLCDSAYQAAQGLRSFPNSYISHRTGSMSDAYLGWQRRWTPGAWQTCKGTRCKYPRVLSSSTLPTWRPEVCVQEAEPCVDPGDGGSGTWRRIRRRGQPCSGDAVATWGSIWSSFPLFSPGLFFDMSIAP